MSASAVNDTERRLLTIKQQINNLKAWNKTQENKLILQKRHKMENEDKENIRRSSSPRNVVINECDKVDEQPLIPRHADFHALLDAKLKEAKSNNHAAGVKKPAEKKAFLKKGEGLSRFKMKTECEKHTESVPPEPKKVTGKSTALKAFEILEEQANDLSFCSTSSMVEQLMEDSIKSTPIKNEFQDEKNKNGATAADQNYEFFESRKLEVIDEEPSKMESTIRDDDDDDSDNSKRCDLIFVDRDNYQRERSFSDCSSACSCQDSHYMSTSVSVFTEETTAVYSPSKRSGEVTAKTGDSDDTVLRSLLQTRLKELEIEIDAFRGENAHLSKLRAEYETEYNRFCEEKAQFLQKIREEHLSDLKELEEEKRKLDREKFAFEKHMKEARNKPNKHEKEEIRLFKEEIKVLKEEMNKKESRWGAAQARIRTEMKQLKEHNAALKTEIEKLQKTPKSVSFAPSTLKKSKSNSNMVSKIDQEIEKMKTTAEKAKTFLSENPLREQEAEFYESRFSGFQRVAPYLGTDYSSLLISSYIQHGDDDLQSLDLSSKPPRAEETHTVAVAANETNVVETADEDGNREKLYADGRKEIWYPNGNVKKISSDERVVKIIYYNGDVKEVLADANMVKYYHAESKIWHSEYSSGLEVTEFPNGQIEKRYKDGTKEVVYPTGTNCSINSLGQQKWTKADGTLMTLNEENNEKRINFPNGRVEVHTAEFKKLEYPDGTTRIMYNDGIQETRYANGRITLKTKDGRLLSDSEITYYLPTDIF